jgi:hypothetical protein
MTGARRGVAVDRTAPDAPRRAAIRATVEFPFAGFTPA